MSQLGAVCHTLRPLCNPEPSHHSHLTKKCSFSTEIPNISTDEGLGTAEEIAGKSVDAAKSVLNLSSSLYYDDRLDPASNLTMAIHNHEAIVPRPLHELAYNRHWPSQNFYSHSSRPFTANQPLPEDNGTNRDADSMILPPFGPHLVCKDRMEGDHTATVIDTSIFIQLNGKISHERVQEQPISTIEATSIIQDGDQTSIKVLKTAEHTGVDGHDALSGTIEARSIYQPQGPIATHGILPCDHSGRVCLYVLKTIDSHQPAASGIPQVEGQETERNDPYVKSEESTHSSDVD